MHVKLLIMKHGTWFSAVVITSLWLAAACSSDEPPGSQGPTHWLRECANDGDCGELSCACGACVAACDDGASCDVPGRSTTCQAASSGAVAALCGAQRASAMCLEPCGAGCATGQRCVAGACIPVASSGTAGSGAGAGGGGAASGRGGESGGTAGSSGRGGASAAGTGSGGTTGAGTGSGGRAGSAGSQPDVACGPSLRCKSATEVCVSHQAFMTTYACEPLPAACGGKATCQCVVDSVCEPGFKTCNDDTPGEIACICIAC